MLAFEPVYAQAYQITVADADSMNLESPSKMSFNSLDSKSHLQRTEAGGNSDMTTALDWVVENDEGLIGIDDQGLLLTENKEYRQMRGQWLKR
jgi:hypothetical protein